MPPVLDPLRVDSRRLGARRATLGALGAAVVVDVFEVEGVDVAGEVAESEKKSTVSEYSSYGFRSIDLP